MFDASTIAREIHYLSVLSGVPCDHFRHFLLTVKYPDPIFEEPGEMVEGHLFVDEDSPARQSFDQAAATFSIARKLDCNVNEFATPQLCYICPENYKPAFERLANERGLQFQWGILPVDKTIMSFRVPDNFTWLICLIGLRSLPPVTDITTQPDWRGFDFEANGLAKAYFTVNDAPIISVDNPAYGLFNKDCLFAFQGKTTVAIKVVRDLFSVPEHQQLNIAVHGYLTSPQAYTCFSNNLTQVEALA